MRRTTRWWLSLQKEYNSRWASPRCYQPLVIFTPERVSQPLGFRHFQRYESTKQAQFDAELAAGDYRSRKSITAGGLQPGVTSRLLYLLQNEYNSRWASGTSSATSRLSNHNVPSGSSANLTARSGAPSLTKSLLSQRSFNAAVWYSVLSIHPSPSHPIPSHQTRAFGARRKG